LVGGGLIRSLGGLQPVKLLRAMGQGTKGDERILGDSYFVSDVLTASQDELARKVEYRHKGYEFDWLSERVARLLEMNVDEVLKAGRYPEYGQGPQHPHCIGRTVSWASVASILPTA